MLILHIPVATPAPWLSEALANSLGREFRVQSISRMETALARIAGGGVGAIVVDVSGCDESVDLTALPALRRRAAKIPIWIAAAGPLAVDGPEKTITPDDAARLATLLTGEANGVTSPSTVRSTPFPAKEGSVFAFVGVKGGVGTTTTALHVAALLSGDRRTILAELRSDRGALADRVKGPSRRGSIEALLTVQPEALTPQLVERQLWNPEMQPGLRVLSAPSFLTTPLAVKADQAQAIVTNLRQRAELVVLDLSFEAREAARAAAPMADEVVIVLERTPYAIRAAQRAIEELAAWGVGRDAMGSVVVTRSDVGAPIAMDEIESELGIPLLAVMPPDADLCAVAESLRKLSFALQPDGLSAASYFQVAEELKRRI